MQGRLQFKGQHGYQPVAPAPAAAGKRWVCGAALAARRLHVSGLGAAERCWVGRAGAASAPGAHLHNLGLTILPLVISPPLRRLLS